jgi:hypothetical protein
MQSGHRSESHENMYKGLQDKTSLGSGTPFEAFKKRCYAHCAVCE